MPEGSESSVYFYFVEKLFKGIFFVPHTLAYMLCKNSNRTRTIQIQKSHKNSQIWAVNKHQMPLYCDLQRTAKHKEDWEQTGRVDRRHTRFHANYHVKTRSISGLLGGRGGRLLHICSPSDSERLLC